MALLANLLIQAVIMRTLPEIEERKKQLLEKMGILEKKQAKEKKKPLRYWNISWLTFMFKEHQLYEFALSQLDWVTGQDEGRATEDEHEEERL